MTARIVAGIDCSPESRDVLTWAVQQAALAGSELRVVSTWGDGLPAAAAGRGSDVASALQAAVDELVTDTLHALPGADVSGRLAIRVTGEDAADELVAESAVADLVVIGKHRRRPGLPLGSTTGKVVSSAACPVAVVPSSVPHPTNRDGGRILVGVDGSALSSRALDWAARQAVLTRWSIVVLMAWEWAPTYAMHPYDAPPEEIRWQCEEDLDAQLAGLPADVKVTSKVLQGRPADLLLAAAREADLLVVGSSGLGAARALLLGSVSRHLVRHARIPVVVAHEHDHPLADLRSDHRAKVTNTSS